VANEMTKREVVRRTLEGRCPPYVPWSFRFGKEAKNALTAHYGTADIEAAVGNPIVELGSDIGFFEDLGNHRVRDVFGVVWDRSVDKDIGNVQGLVLPGATLRGYDFPDPLDRRFFADIPDKLRRVPDSFRLYCLGFSLFERAWTLRGMENLFLDFSDHPAFVHDLLNTIADYNIAQIREALRHDIDAVYFGDDWGQQRGLLMGYRAWKELLFPVLRRMYEAVTGAGKYLFIHSCGDVEELFDDLIDIGLACSTLSSPRSWRSKRYIEDTGGGSFSGEDSPCSKPSPLGRSRTSGVNPSGSWRWARREITSSHPRTPSGATLRSPICSRSSTPHGLNPDLPAAESRKLRPTVKI
jgi:uroporphyrinogen decarboxylase